MAAHVADLMRGNQDSSQRRRLPSVRLAPRDELAGMARVAPLLRAARDLGEWAEHNAGLIADSELAPATVAAAAAALDLAPREVAAAWRVVTATGKLAGPESGGQGLAAVLARGETEAILRVWDAALAVVLDSEELDGIATALYTVGGPVGMDGLFDAYASAAGTRRQPGPAGTEPAGTEPAGTEPAGTEPAGTEPAGSEPAGSEPAGSEPAGTEPAGTEPAGTEPAGTEPAGTEPAGTESAGTEPAGTEPAGTEPAGTEPAGTGPAGTGPAGSESGRLESAGAGPADAVSTGGRAADGGRRDQGAALSLALETLADLGVVELGTEDSDGSLTVALSPLGTWGVHRRLRAQGWHVPVLGAALREGAQGLLAALANCDAEDGEAEITTWLGSRDPAAAAAELIEAAASGSPGQRGAAFAVLDRIGLPAIEQVRGALDQPLLRAHAAVWLIEHGEEVHLDPADRTWLLVDLGAGLLEEANAHDVVAELLPDLPPEDQAEIVARLWEVSHPGVTSFLTALSDHHPDPAVARAARKAAFKARSPAASTD